MLAPEDALQTVGVNLAGAEFNPEGGVGTYAKDYIYPNRENLAYYRGKGMRLVRLPFRWERLQPTLKGPLAPAELKRLLATVRQAGALGMSVIVSPHNYARYRIGGEEKLIGSPEVPVEAFTDFWIKLATVMKDERAVAALSLMNEPHDTNGTWKKTAQAGIDAIRTVDRAHIILVPGDAWSGAWSWRLYNEDLVLKDPSNKLIYDAHQYFDRNSSGFYKEGYDENGAFPGIGIERLSPFVNWLRERKLKGIITEFGVPNSDPRWLVVLDQFLQAMAENGLGGTYWAGGPWWGDYPLSSEPKAGADAPVMSVLGKYGCSM